MVDLTLTSMDRLAWDRMVKVVTKADATVTTIDLEAARAISPAASKVDMEVPAARKADMEAPAPSTAHTAAAATNTVV